MELFIIFIVVYIGLAFFTLNAYRILFNKSDDGIRLFLGIFLYKELYPYLKFLVVISIILSIILEKKLGL